MFRLATRKRRSLLRILGTLVVTVCLSAAGLAAAPLTSAMAIEAAQGQHVVSPQVVHTGMAPTGYEVTFRYYDPTATTVQIRGEWFFSSPADTTTTSSQGVLPAQWQPGDFPIAYPNQGPAPNWPVTQMTLDKATGVWSYTTPAAARDFYLRLLRQLHQSAAGPGRVHRAVRPEQPAVEQERLSRAGQPGLCSVGSAFRHAQPVLVGAEPAAPRQAAGRLLSGSPVDQSGRLAPAGRLPAARL
jgi:hypothetical protein